MITNRTNSNSFTKMKKTRLEAIVEENAALRKKYSNELETAESGMLIPEKLQTKAARILAQAEAIVEDSIGGYNNAVGAKPTSGMGAIGIIPSTILPLSKRFMSGSTFIRDLIDLQVLAGPSGMIFGIRFTNGQFGDGTVLDISRELGRPMNNRISSGNLKFIFSGTVAANAITVNSFKLVDGSFIETMAVAAGNVTGIPSNYIRANAIVIGGTTYTVTWNYVAMVAMLKTVGGVPALSNALVPQMLRAVDSGSYDTAVEAEMFISELSLTGVGLRVDYAVTLEDYKRELSNDPAAGDIYANTVSDVYTKTFTGDEGANAKFQKLTPRIDTENLETESNELFAEWPRKLEDDANATLGIDMNSVIVEQGSKIMIDTVDRECLTRMKMVSVNKNKGGARAKVFNLAGANAVQGAWMQEKLTSLVISMNASSEEIFRSTGRLGRGDFAITTPSVSVMMISAKSLYNDFKISDNRKNNAAELGEVTGITLYSDIWSELVDQGIGTLNRRFAQMLVGMKARGEGEAGIVLGTYKPVTVYGPIRNPQDMNLSVLIETRYGISDTIIDPGTFYRAAVVEGVETALYGA